MGSVQEMRAMNLKRALPLVLVLSVGAVASESALAQRHGGGHSAGAHHGGHRGGHSGARIGLGVGIGLGLLGLAYYAAAPHYVSPPTYYYPPTPYYYPPVVQYAPPTYIEQPAPQAGPAQQSQASWWYYCADARAYYPYVKECPGGWQRVSPTPPG
jgi:hypothetical protein